MLYISYIYINVLFVANLYVQTYGQQMICHVLLHFLFPYCTVSILRLLLYLTCSSVMETPKVQ